jgi:dTDP-4-amino-4,6-dideoxygalactose transaminase
VSKPGSYQIPIVDLRAQYGNIRDEVRQAIGAVVESQQFILGPAVKSFEEQMSTYLCCAHAVGVASGSDALLLALMALDIAPGDGVITTPFTFFSTVSSITRLGATPLFVDIDPESYLISPLGVERFLTERGRSSAGNATVPIKTGVRIKALLPVHLFGQICAMERFAALAERYRFQIVEDVAQACGARLTMAAGQIKFAGSIGALGCFSFFPSKNLGGFGDGGMVTTNDPALADKIRMLRMHGERTKYHHEVTGLNSRLDSLQATVLSMKLKYLEAWCGQRIERAARYHELFRRSGLLGNGISNIPPLSTDKAHVFNNYVVRAERRNDLKQFLAERRIQSEIYYPLPLHMQKCFADLGYREGDFPHAERAAREVLALPLYPELTSEQQVIVVDAVKAFYRA